MRKWRVAAVPVVAGLLVWGWWTWSHPTVLANTSALGNFAFDPQSVNTSYYVGVGGADRTRATEVVTLRAVTPHLAENSAASAVSTYICRTRGTDAAGSMSNMETVSQVCSSFTPFKPGQKLRLFGGAGRDEIVLKISPTRPGQTRIDEVLFSYTRDRSHLWQRGTEVSKQDWRVTAR